MKFSCTHCGQHISVETLHQGAVAQCPGCGKDITVPKKEDTSQTLKFDCRHCGQRMAVESMYMGIDAQCPRCGKNIKVPDKADLDDAAGQEDGATGEVDAEQTIPAAAAQEAVKTIQSTIDRAERTISQYMSEQDIEGGVDLNDSLDGSTASQYLTAEQGRRYKLGRVVTTGGMGAILDAKEHNLRRNVAMKVILNPEKATKEHVLRFIEEAQVTAQLEHPSIVPVHELGVDSSGNVFYTMKMIRGTTFKDVLKRIADDDGETIREYPLSRLVNIFQRVCDAVAFAHSKHVINRDLKPENIMIGEYGEVQLIDWGLAKVLKKGEQETGSDDERVDSKRPAVDSVRTDESIVSERTMVGAIMGTPGYMAPEQAGSDIADVDERTDIYALGAILYSILTLNKPISCSSLDEFIERVTSGDIPHPSTFNPVKTKSWTTLTQRKDEQDAEEEAVDDTTTPVLIAEPSLPHCPGERIPDSLAAVAMKALATDREDRYQSVKELQSDIEAYQSGFATSAEEAGFLKQAVLFYNRHKVSASLGAAVFVAVLIGGVIAGTQWIRAEQRFKELKAIAPDLIEASKRLVEARDLPNAIEKAEYAVSLAATNIEYRLHFANLLQASLQFNRAQKEYEAVLKRDTQNRLASINKEICVGLRMKQARDPKSPFMLIPDLYPKLIEQERYEQAIAMFTSIDASASSVVGLKDVYESQLLGKGVKVRSCQVGANGTLALNIYGMGVSDLSPLKGLPLTSLNVAYTKELVDLSPLRGIPLTSLNVARCGNVGDLSPIRGMPLESLNLDGCGKVNDLSPLKGMPLKSLNLDGCGKVKDLSPLKGMPLESLNLAGCSGVADLSPLKGMPLTNLNLTGCAEVTNLAPLKDMALTSLPMAGTAATDLSPLKGKMLVSVDLKDCPHFSDLSPLAGMPFTSLDLRGCKGVRDLSPLRGWKLTSLHLAGTQVESLAPLQGLPLEFLSLTYATYAPCPATDLSPLQGMPLKTLSLADFWRAGNAAAVNDISPLASLPLESISLFPSRITKGLDGLRGNKALKTINTMPTAAFWKKYDAGELKDKPR